MMNRLSNLDRRQKFACIVASAALLTILIIGGYLLIHQSASKYAGLNLWRETQIDDATKATLNQRIATTIASISTKPANTVPTEMTALYLSIVNDSYVLGDLATCRQYLELALNNNSLMDSAWNMYGDILSQMGDRVIAESAYKQAIQINPMVKYYMDYAGFLAKDSPARDADQLADLQQAVTVLGQSTDLMVALAEYYNNHSDCSESIAHYKVAVTLSPQNQAIKDDLAMVKSTCVQQSQ
jgi:Tfp pilus assembly protein PilF